MLQVKPIFDSRGAALKESEEGRKFFKKRLILAFEVIVGPPEHTSNITLFPCLAQCVFLDLAMICSVESRVKIFEAELVQLFAPS